MKRNRRLTLMLCLLLTTLLACSSSSKATTEIEKKFQTIAPLENMNKSLQLKLDNKDNTFQLDSDIPITISNLSPSFVYSDFNSNITIYLLKDSEWMKIKNEINYSGTMLLSPKDTLLLDLQYIYVKPKFEKNMLPKIRENTLLRIVIYGEVMENDKLTGNMVGAYVDVYISP